jgi:hypothetical protein
MMTVVEETVQQALRDFRFVSVKFVIWRKNGYSMWHAWDTKFIIREPYGVCVGGQDLNMRMISDDIS